MEERHPRYGEQLAKSKGVGLFYFAGHGLQLSWRNFLVPVDASLDRAEDVPRQTVDLAALLGGIGKAGNPMNIVILDACRDNPFGGELKSGKGLSQMDAPIGTLLAYATAPGNVASDGSGANGLYTEHLLREIRTPEAKIEDVFKRVRLAVRRASQGQQIPWESTSLEEDFYFLPPASLRKLSEEELARQFAEEGASGRRPSRRAIAAVEDYIRRYPSGHFSELAQVRLDRLLAAGREKSTSRQAAANPFSAREPASLRTTGRRPLRLPVDRPADPGRESPQGGQHRHRDHRGQGDLQQRALVTDLLGNILKRPDGSELQPSQMFVGEYSLGKKWTTRYDRSPVPTGTSWSRSSRRADQDSPCRLAAAWVGL
jgi:hypothetical protein